MKRFETEAIVLRGIDYGESDRIVTFFTREIGKIRGIAKGVKRSRRRFPNGLDIGYHLHISFIQKEGFDLGRVEDSQLIESFDAIAAHAERFVTACYLLEVITISVPDHEPNIPLYRLLRDALYSLERGEWIAQARYLFELQTLFLCGYRPNFEWCGRCQNPLPLERERYFSRDKGLVLCKGCSLDLPWITRLSPETTKTLQRGLQTPVSQAKALPFTPKISQESKRFLNHALSLRLQRPLRSQPILDSFHAF